MERQGGDISSAVHDLLRELVQLQATPVDYLASELDVPEATLHGWLQGDLQGLTISHVAALHKFASRPFKNGASLELAPHPSSFPPGSTVADAVVSLDDRMQRLEQSLAIQSDLLRQVWHLSGKAHSMAQSPETDLEPDLSGAVDSQALATDERHDEWSRQLSTYARDGLITEAITILDELIASQGGAHAT